MGPERQLRRSPLPISEALLQPGRSAADRELLLHSAVGRRADIARHKHARGFRHPCTGRRRQVQLRRRSRHHRARLRLFRQADGTDFLEGALSRHRAGGERPRRRAPAGLLIVLCDPAAAAAVGPHQGPGANGSRTRAEPAGYPDRRGGGLPSPRDGRTGRPVWQPRDVGGAARKNRRRHRRRGRRQGDRRQAQCDGADPDAWRRQGIFRGDGQPARPHRENRKSDRPAANTVMLADKDFLRESTTPSRRACVPRLHGGRGRRQRADKSERSGS